MWAMLATTTEKYLKLNNTFKTVARTFKTKLTRANFSFLVVKLLCGSHQPQISDVGCIVNMTTHLLEEVLVSEETYSNIRLVS